MDHERDAVNVSVSHYPIEMLPIIFRYGYAKPFYNVSNTARAIIFNAKNHHPAEFASRAVFRNPFKAGCGMPKWTRIPVTNGLIRVHRQHHRAKVGWWCWFRQGGGRVAVRVCLVHRLESASGAVFRNPSGCAMPNLVDTHIVTNGLIKVYHRRRQAKPVVAVVRWV